jgi:hypothetical protein
MNAGPGSTISPTVSRLVADRACNLRAAIIQSFYLADTEVEINRC